ncbi:hypothetical protein ACHAWF_011655 [Thalassiosira exigua]
MAPTPTMADTDDVVVVDFEAPPPAAAAAAKKKQSPRPYKKATKNYYTQENKLKRYFSVLREFMAFVHGRVDGEPYPAEHKFSEAELQAVEPQDIGKFRGCRCRDRTKLSRTFNNLSSRSAHAPLRFPPRRGAPSVNWMNMKVFQTLEPDYSGATPVSGVSHHTLSFYRKSIGHFLPAGPEEWNPEEKTGNASRSPEIREVMNKVKELREKGALTIKNPHYKKREWEENDGGYLTEEDKQPKKRARRSRKSSENAPDADENPVLTELNGLLREMDNQKKKFLQGLDEMSAAVETMKSDVTKSYDFMIARVSNISTRVVTAPKPTVEAAAAVPVLRSHNLFTVWTVEDGRLTPLASDWTFPSKASVLEAMRLWLIGDRESRTPPLQYVTTVHMKHVKGPCGDAHRAFRRFMRMVKYIGLKAGYWCKNWDSEKIATFWGSKVWPAIRNYLHPSLVTPDAATGSMGCRTLVNALYKNGVIIKEMTDNPQILSDEEAISNVVKSTEEELLSARAIDEDDNGIEATYRAATKFDEIEMLWGVHHGKLNPFPPDWEFPCHDSIIDVLYQWFLGNPDDKIPPLRYAESAYVAFIQSGKGYLSKLRCVVNACKHHGIKLGCWYEDDEDWDKEKILFLWEQVWDEVEGQLDFKPRHGSGREGEITWQTIYNKMYENGLLRDVKADEKREADQVKAEDPELLDE